MPAGRPSSYTPEIAAQVCDMIADGMSLREIDRNPDMPAKVTIFKWIGQFPEFANQYAHAKQSQAEHMAEDLLEIVDDGTNDWMERTDADGKTAYVLNGEHVQRSKLRADTRKWLISKLLPKKYGEKLSTEVSGPDGGPIPVGRVELVPGKP